jgi:hypothetical protein
MDYVALEQIQCGCGQDDVVARDGVDPVHGHAEHLAGTRFVLEREHLPPT